MKVRAYISALLAALLITGLSTQAVHAQETPDDLKETMQELLASMQGIVEGIMTDDYTLISGMAENIAFHKGPSAKRRMAIANELGIEALTFRMFDDSLRQSALELKKAADKKNTQQVVDEYKELVKNCIACHSNYRKQLRVINK